MEQIVNITSWSCLLTGGALSIIGGIGLNRFPDFYSRSHAAGITDTLGAGLILLGLVLQAGPTLVAVKLGFIFAFLAYTSPTSTHALAHGAWVSGLKPLLGADLKADGAADKGDAAS